MECKLRELRYKEVINITDGCRYGCVGDASLDLESGRLVELVIPGRPRLFGLLGREEDMVFPWSAVRQFGEDIILVEGKGRRRRGD